MDSWLASLQNSESHCESPWLLTWWRTWAETRVTTLHDSWLQRVKSQEWAGLCWWPSLGLSGYRLVFNLTQLESATRVYIYFPVINMSPRACTETLSRRLEANLRECRESLSFLEKAVKMAVGQTPGQEQEVLVSAIETSAIFHKSADRIYESLLVWLSEEELDHRYGYSRLAVTSLQTRLQGAAILKTMRREMITATDAGNVNPTTVTTEGDLLNLQETPPVTSMTMSVPAGLSSQSVPSPAVSTSAWSASRPSPPAGKPAVNLPKLSLPTFSGEYLKFNAFWQAFKI